MKTKAQKNVDLNEAINLVKDSKNLVFVDFTGTGVEALKTLRKIAKDNNSAVKVVKKKLLRVAFEKQGIDFNPEKYDSQLATIFSKADISEIVPPVFKFYKENEKKGFKLLGAYNLTDNHEFDEAMIKTIGQLPSRDVLLSQFVGMLTAPLRMFMYVLDQKSKQGTEA